jgi:hypothetical protein
MRAPRVDPVNLHPDLEQPELGKYSPRNPLSPLYGLRSAATPRCACSTNTVGTPFLETPGTT